MDELADEALVKELCQKIRNNIAEIKKYITDFQSLLETYKEKKNLLNSALESLDIAKKEYMNAKEELENNFGGNAAIRRIKSLDDIINAVTLQSSKIMNDKLPRVTNKVNNITTKIETIESSISNVSQLSNRGELESLSVPELESYVTHTTQTLEEIKKVNSLLQN